MINLGFLKNENNDVPIILSGHLTTMAATVAYFSTFWTILYSPVNLFATLFFLSWSKKQHYLMKVARLKLLTTANSPHHHQ